LRRRSVPSARLVCHPCPRVCAFVAALITTVGSAALCAARLRTLRRPSAHFAPSDAARLRTLRRPSAHFAPPVCALCAARLRRPSAALCAARLRTLRRPSAHFAPPVCALCAVRRRPSALCAARLRPGRRHHRRRRAVGTTRRRRLRGCQQWLRDRLRQGPRRGPSLAPSAWTARSLTSRDGLAGWARELGQSHPQRLEMCGSLVQSQEAMIVRRGPDSFTAAMCARAARLRQRDVQAAPLYHSALTERP